MTAPTHEGEPSGSSCPACPDELAAWAIVEDLADAALGGDTDARRLLPAAINHALGLRG